MNIVKKYIKETDRIRELIKPIVDEYYPSKANKEVMSLHDLITFGILAHLHFNGVIKHAYTHFIEDLGLFPKIRYNKLIERLNRYEDLLYKVLDYVFKKISEEEVKIVDAKPVETKELVRSNRYKKRGESKIIREEESVGYTPSKKDTTMVTR